jgi:hypothetical protein
MHLPHANNQHEMQRNNSLQQHINHLQIHKVHTQQLNT